MDAQKEKGFHLVFLLFLAFTVYYTFSAYRGSMQMADYDVSRLENEKKIKTLDSVIALADEKGFTEEELNDFASQQESAYQRRDTIESNTKIGSGVYHSRLIKLYLELGMTVLSFGLYRYSKRKGS